MKDVLSLPGKYLGLQFAFLDKIYGKFQTLCTVERRLGNSKTVLDCHKGWLKWKHQILLLRTRYKGSTAADLVHYQDSIDFCVVIVTFLCFVNSMLKVIFGMRLFLAFILVFLTCSNFRNFEDAHGKICTVFPPLRLPK